MPVPRRDNAVIMDRVVIDKNGIGFQVQMRHVVEVRLREHRVRAVKEVGIRIEHILVKLPAVGLFGDDLLQLGDRLEDARLGDANGRAVGAARDLQQPFVEQARGVDLHERAVPPDVTEIGVAHVKFHADIDIVLVVRRHGVDPRNLADGKTHDRHRIAHAQAGGALDVAEKSRLDDKPTPLFRRVVEVIAKTKQQQRGRQKHKPADRAFHPAQARAQLRSQVLQSHNRL
jgi:hypothetical protein